MILEREKVDLELVSNIVTDMISGERGSDYWWAFINGMSTSSTDINIENLWYVDCVYSKLFGPGDTTAVTAGTPSDVLEENFSEVVQYASENGYFEIDDLLDFMNHL